MAPTRTISVACPQCRHVSAEPIEKLQKLVRDNFAMSCAKCGWTIQIRELVADARTAA